MTVQFPPCKKDYIQQAISGKLTAVSLLQMTKKLLVINEMNNQVILFNIHRTVLMEVLEVIVPLFLLPVLKYTYPDLTSFNFSNF